MEIWDPTHNLETQRGIVMAYMYEARAREVQAMQPDARVGYPAWMQRALTAGLRAAREINDAA